jgi:DNA-binding FrmR family transcriptional regulator
MDTRCRASAGARRHLSAIPAAFFRAALQKYVSVTDGEIPKKRKNATFDFDLVAMKHFCLALRVSLKIYDSGDHPPLHQMEPPTRDPSRPSRTSKINPIETVLDLLQVSFRLASALCQVGVIEYQ